MQTTTFRVIECFQHFPAASACAQLPPDKAQPQQRIPVLNITGQGLLGQAQSPFSKPRRIAGKRRLARSKRAMRLLLMPIILVAFCFRHGLAGDGKGIPVKVSGNNHNQGQGSKQQQGTE